MFLVNSVRDGGERVCFLEFKLPQDQDWTVRGALVALPVKPQSVRIAIPKGGRTLLTDAAARSIFKSACLEASSPVSMKWRRRLIAWSVTGGPSQGHGRGMSCMGSSYVSVSPNDIFGCVSDGTSDDKALCPQ